MIHQLLLPDRVHPPNQFVPEIVSHLPCSSGLARHKLLFVYFFKELISFIGSLHKCHTSVFNALIPYVIFHPLAKFEKVWNIGVCKGKPLRLLFKVFATTKTYLYLFIYLLLLLSLLLLLLLLFFMFKSFITSICLNVHTL